MISCQIDNKQRYRMWSHQIFELVVDKDSLHVQSHGSCRCCEHVSRELIWNFSGEENHRLFKTIARQREQSKKRKSTSIRISEYCSHLEIHIALYGEVGMCCWLVICVEGLLVEL